MLMATTQQPQSWDKHNVTIAILTVSIMHVCVYVDLVSELLPYIYV